MAFGSLYEHPKVPPHFQGDLLPCCLAVPSGAFPPTTMRIERLSATRRGRGFMRFALILATSVLLLLEEVLSDLSLKRRGSLDGSHRGVDRRKGLLEARLSSLSCSPRGATAAASAATVACAQGFATIYAQVVKAAGERPSSKSETSLSKKGTTTPRSTVPLPPPPPPPPPPLAEVLPEVSLGAVEGEALAKRELNEGTERGGGTKGMTRRFERGQAAAAQGVKEVLPSVTLKLAMDRNGAVDDMSEGPKRFTSQESLDAVHRIRRDCGAVLVGVGTVVRDDPSLTVRRVPLHEGQTKQPTRVVLDRTLRLTGGQAESTARAVLRDGHASVVFYSAECKETEARAAQLAADLQQSGAEPSSSTGESERSIAPLEQASPVVDFVGLPARSPGAGVDLSTVLEKLFKRGVDHVLVEGGPSVARSFLSEGLVDRAIIVRAPVEFSRPVPSGIEPITLRRAGLQLVGSVRWGDDEAECWTRPGLNWPGGGVDSWP